MLLRSNSQMSMGACVTAITKTYSILLWSLKSAQDRLSSTNTITDCEIDRSYIISRIKPMQCISRLNADHAS